MAGARYSIYISDPFGVRLGDASKFVSLQYSRIVNDVGTLTLTLPRSFDTSLLLEDGRIEVWRRLPGSSREYLDTDTVWLIKAIEYDRDDQGRTTIRVEADTPLCIFREPGRFIDITQGSIDAARQDPCDDMLKNIVLQNAGNLATAARDLSAYLTVAPNLSLCPTAYKTFEWRDMLKTLQEIAASSTQAGTYLAFDIVAPTPDTLQFRTFVGQRGVDHRFPSGQNPVIIGAEFGNMGASSLRYDYRKEATYVLAGGQGVLLNRLTGSAQDTSRQGKSPWGRRELFVNATQYNTATGLAAEAQAQLRAGRPRTIFKGKMLDTPGTRYGVHWGWGDFVTVQDQGLSFDARIDAVTVKVSKGKETIEAYLRNDA